MSFCIVEARSIHLGIIAGQLTPEERSTFQCDARRVMRGFFRESAYRRTALLDDRPIAIWGITGSLVSTSGILWLRLTAAARKMPRLVVEQSREELVRMLEVRREIMVYIAAFDQRAIRFAEFFGFEFGEPMVIDGMEFPARWGIVRR